MSNNARVVDGGEIGVAQYLQALAAGVEPDVRMNPVLVKPEADDRSQVVAARPRRPRAEPRAVARAAAVAVAGRAKRAARAARGVRARADRGRGQPGRDQPALDRPREHALGARCRRARACSSPTSTAAARSRTSTAPGRSSTEDDRATSERLRAQQVPRRRAPARSRARATSSDATGMALRRRCCRSSSTGCPTRTAPRRRRARPGAPRVAVVRYPTASNLDELKPLEQVARPRLGARRRAISTDADLVVLPGSKHVSADLALAARARARRRDRGCRAAWHARARHLRRSADARRDEIVDPAGVDGAADGLGLLAGAHDVRSGEADARPSSVAFGALPEPWRALSGLAFAATRSATARPRRRGAWPRRLPGGRGFVAGAGARRQRPRRSSSSPRSSPRCSGDGPSGRSTPCSRSSPTSSRSGSTWTSSLGLAGVA